MITNIFSNGQNVPRNDRQNDEPVERHFDRHHSKDLEGIFLKVNASFNHLEIQRTVGKYGIGAFYDSPVINRDLGVNPLSTHGYKGYVVTTLQIFLERKFKRFWQIAKDGEIVATGETGFVASETEASVAAANAAHGEIDLRIEDL